MLRLVYSELLWKHGATWRVTRVNIYTNLLTFSFLLVSGLLYTIKVYIFFSNDVIKTMFFSTLCMNMDLYSLIQNIDLFLVGLLKFPCPLWNA